MRILNRKYKIISFLDILFLSRMVKTSCLRLVVWIEQFWVLKYHEFVMRSTIIYVIIYVYLLDPWYEFPSLMQVQLLTIVCIPFMVWHKITHWTKLKYHCDLYYNIRFSSSKQKNKTKQKMEFSSKSKIL